LKKSKKPEEVQKPSYSVDQLLQALMWTWDAFERAQMGMFLVKDTAVRAIQNIDLDGDAIYVGIRDTEWSSGSTPILKAFTGEPVGKTDTTVTFKNPLNPVPTIVYILPEDPCIRSTDQIFYRNEYFKVPNPFKRFMEVYGNI
jgi:hypothetical protein